MEQECMRELMGEIARLPGQGVPVVVNNQPDGSVEDGHGREGADPEARKRKGMDGHRTASTLQGKTPFPNR